MYINSKCSDWPLVITLCSLCEWWEKRMVCIQKSIETKFCLKMKWKMTSTGTQKTWSQALSPPPLTGKEEEKWTREGVEAWDCWIPNSEDLLWEQKPTFHCAFMVLLWLGGWKAKTGRIPGETEIPAPCGKQGSISICYGTKKKIIISKIKLQISSIEKRVCKPKRLKKKAVAEGFTTMQKKKERS